MRSPFHHIRHAQETFDHFHRNLHHAFVLIVGAIIGMLRWASQILVPHIRASRQRWGFITSDFREQSPTPANIAYALFGDGTPWSTAYTRTRSTSCVPSNGVVYLPSDRSWQLMSSNTIYLINSWTYTLSNPIRFSSRTCSALIGIGNVIIKTAWSNTNAITSSSNIIIDNIKFDGQNMTTYGNYLNGPFNVTLHNIDAYQDTGYGIFTISTNNLWIYDSNIYNNGVGAWISANTTINNSKIYNNGLWINAYQYDNIAINNSQIFNNTIGIKKGYYSSPCPMSLLCMTCSWTDYINTVINNSLIYNNDKWIYIDACFNDDNGIQFLKFKYILNNTKIYNNTYGVYSLNSDPLINYYWTLQFFDNSANTWGTSYDNISWSTNPPILTRSNGTMQMPSTSMDYDYATNPQNGSGERLLSGSVRTSLRWLLSFTPISSIRYIFWGDIIKQIIPVRYNSSTLTAFGINGSDYKTTRYITEPDSTLSADDQALVEQYFWSGSLYTQNRTYNGCSLSAFQVVHLDPATFTSQYGFQDHTIYILTGGDYISDIISGYPFVFDGNCIAVIGNGKTKFTKNGGSGILSMLYAYNKRNIIIDSIKMDGLYHALYGLSWPAQAGIRFGGSTNNSTINNVQIYNNGQYGILLGLWSHHNTIMNAQLFNNAYAGIFLYYASDYNVINNTQTFNNGQYGIQFANGSSRNTMNNFQSYNNIIGVFGDLTTMENVLNRAAIYNNSDAGIYFKNSSGNSLNDVRIYNNNIAIRTLYNSPGNKYYGELKLFDNRWGNFDGTDGNDISFAPSNGGLFAYAGTLTTGTNLMWCTYVTNPTLSWGTDLLWGGCTRTWYITSFVSSLDTNVSYMFGLNMYKQTIPQRYTSGSASLTPIPSQYDSGKYIAEVFAVRDDEPEFVGFASSGSAQLNTRYTTEVYTAGTVNIPVLATLSFDPSTTTGYLIISGATMANKTGIVNNGNPVQVKVLTKPGYNETVTGYITIGSATTAAFSITTRGMSQTPTTWSFAFANLTSIPVDTFTGSTTTVSGIETGILASIAFSPIDTSGRLEIYSGGTLISSWTTWLLVYNGNQVKAIAKSSSGYSQTVTWYVAIGLGTGTFTIKTKWSDSTPPTAPVLTYPLSGEELFFITFEWIAAVDTGSGLEGYRYQIAEDSNFMDVVNSGFIATNSGTSGSPDTDFEETSDSYYRRLQAVDRDGNASARSNTWRFEAIESTEREFNDVKNANLRTYYDSDEITIEGMKDNTSLRASVEDNATLYKNGDEKWTWTYVQNGDDVFITLRSSNRYDKTVSSVLTIANRALEFNVKTKEESTDWCTLSDDDQQTIQDIFDSLVENYSGSQDRYDEFLYTMQSMLADEIDFTNDCNLQYLEDLINEDLGISLTGSVNTGTHIAPNCKEYGVTYENTKSAYTSPTFKVITYFANRDALTRYIDSKNPGDCHINTYGVSTWIFTNTDPAKHIAANGKIYTITSDGQGYTSPEFVSAKHFASISALRTYIDGNNPPLEVRNHQVDTSFTPQTYTAPNSKEYVIYKTNRWYMSYKLMKVRYFSSLAEIQSYINKNNPR